ncbi:MAG: TonB-dependent receptor domain-containing protein [Candidatus Omnitrophota bacterium]
MNSKRFMVFIFLFLFLQIISLAKTIDGQVIDTNRHPLDKVKITILNMGESTVFTDENGRFNLDFREGMEKATITFEKDGFFSEKRDLNLKQEQKPLVVILSPTQAFKETVTVNAERIQGELVNTPSAVSLIGESELETIPRSVGAEEALRGVPGVKVDNQANGERVHISIRGQGILSERGIRGIQVLLDGIPLNDPTGFAPDLFDVDWATVNKIEVLRGPSASLYGGGSAGGVINIGTRNGGPNPLNSILQGFIGSNGFWKTLGEASGKTDNIDYRVTASRTMGDGYRVHTKFWANNVTGKLNWQPSSNFHLHTIVIGTGFFNENAEGLNLTWLSQDRRMANPDAITFNEYQKTRRMTGGVNGQWELNKNQSLNFTVYFRRTLYDESVPSSVQHRTYQTPGSSLQYQLRLGEGCMRNLISVGIDSDWQKIDDYRHPNLGLAVEGPGLLSDQLIKQHRLGIYVIDRIEFGTHWSLFFNARHDRITNKLDDFLKANGLDLSGEMNFNKTTGRVGITFNPSAELGFYASWGQGFLPPATEELYANPNALGGFNLQLRPATSHGFEFGVRGTVEKRFVYDVTVFNLITHNDFERYRITARPLETFYGNAGNSRRWGLETMVNWMPVDPLSISVAYTYSDFKYTKYESKVYSGNLVGNRLPNCPVHMATVDISYRLGRNWYFGIGEDFQSKAYIDPTNKASIDGFGLLSARLAYMFQIGKFQGEIFATGRNLTNKKYIAFTEPDPDGNSYQPGPEREVFAGIQLTF